MLETRNLVKIYKPKKGVPVKALDGVSLKFPDTGMIFLLGKSGSGKSTLLNVLGGLDNYNSGEIIIKGVSSKKFKQRHFDSYRNTYVGFIFQEYNVLEEFSVGANIALALELQGKKATDAAINEILNQVDLQGFGNRRPNELSGGQKQRVAIARALVKNPKIIMADEPTGALDSRTGKQVFDTLKKLSAHKLVIVVSHDRDFAMSYADRIIELADGKIISDTTLCENQASNAAGLTFEGNKAKIPMGYRLTEADRDVINAYMERLQQGGELEFTSAMPKHSFSTTDPAKIQHTDKTPFKLIKSKLSLRHSFKIGSSGLKHKKFRLVMTILLSCVAFGLFGLADTFGSYDHIRTATSSLQDSQITYASLSKSVRMGSGINTYWSGEFSITDEEIAAVIDETDIDFQGVVSSDKAHAYFGDILDRNNESDINSEFYSRQFYGATEIDQNSLDAFGYTVTCGNLPDGKKNEIAISEYIADSFIEAGGVIIRELDPKAGLKDTVKKVKSYNDMIGVNLTLNNGYSYTVTAVIDTKFNRDGRYNDLIDNKENSITSMILTSEFYSEIQNSLSGMMMLGKDGIKTNMSTITNFVNSQGHFEFQDDRSYFWCEGATTLSNLNPDFKNKIVWLDGEKTYLGKKEIIVTQELIEQNFIKYDNYGNSVIDSDEILKCNLKLNAYDYINDKRIEDEDGYRIVGYIKSDYNNFSVDMKYSADMSFYTSMGYADISTSISTNNMVISDDLYKEFFEPYEGIYSRIIAPMPDGEDLTDLVEYCYDDENSIRFPMNNPVCFELDNLHEIFVQLSTIFLYIGLAFAVFASLLLSNFIATSISYKKQEIGILRAIGSRSNDVFRIFFAESFIIAMINFVLSTTGVFVVTNILNNVFREEVGILVTILHCGIRQILLLFVVSILVAFLASFLPVKKIASKRPIDAIRNR